MKEHVPAGAGRVACRPGSPKDKTRAAPGVSRAGFQIAVCIRLGTFITMSTLTAIFDPNPDGTVHLPLPEELRTRKLKIFAILTPIESGEQIPLKVAAGGFGCLKGKIHAAPDFDAPLADFRN
jgi:hypothetical protein